MTENEIFLGKLLWEALDIIAAMPYDKAQAEYYHRAIESLGNSEFHAQPMLKQVKINSDGQQ